MRGKGGNENLWDYWRVFHDGKISPRLVKFSSDGVESYFIYFCQKKMKEKKHFFLPFQTEIKDSGEIFVPATTTNPP
jgi:hypothetical protein